MFRFHPFLLVALPLVVAVSDVAVLKTSTFSEETKEGFWLLEFYAPWCGHCKKLNPILDEISVEAREKGMRIGKIDTTVEKKLSDEFKVTGYPTLKFRRDSNDSWKTYEGGRTGKALLKFADRMNSDALPSVTNEGDISAILERSGVDGSGVAFVFGGSGGDSWLSAVANTASDVQHKAFCGMISKVPSWNGPSGSTSLFPTGPFLAALQYQEAPRYFPGDAAQVAPEQLAEWIVANDYPMLSNISASNFRRLGKLGKLLVLAIVDPENSTTAAYLEGVAGVARSVAASTEGAETSTGDWKDMKRPADHFVFGYLDGVKWSEFIEQFNIYGDLPRFVVLDSPKEIFYSDPSVDEVDEMTTFLSEVFEGKVPAQREGMKGSVNRFIAKVKSMGWRFYVMLLPFVGLVISACLISPSEPVKRD